MMKLPMISNGALMSLKTISLLLCFLILFGCSPKAPPPNSSLSLKQLMEWVIDPHADVVWDSVKFISNKNGDTEIYPRSDEQWESVRNSSATLIEAGNMLMVVGRSKDDQQWIIYAHQLSQTAELALKASIDKNKEALFDAGGNIYNACKACHDKYADFDKPVAK